MTTAAVGEKSTEISPLGPDGVLLCFAKASSPEVTDQVLGFAETLRAATLPGVTEIATALTSVLVKFDPDCISRAALTDLLHPLLADQQTETFHAQRRWMIPVAFGGEAGPQLAEAGPEGPDTNRVARVGDRLRTRATLHRAASRSLGDSAPAATDSLGAGGGAGGGAAPVGAVRQCQHNRMAADRAVRLSPVQD